MTAKPKLLSRDDILAASDQTTEDEDVPEWGGKVRVSTLSGSDREHYMSSLYRMKPNGTGGIEVSEMVLDGSQVRLVALAAVDEQGERLFSEADVIELAKKNGAALERVYKRAARLNRLGQTIEQVKADLGVAQNGSSGSA